MSRLMKKFGVGLILVLSAVTLLSLYVNQNLIQRFYLYQEKKELNQTCDQLRLSGDDFFQTAALLEERNQVVIAAVSQTQDNDQLNESLRRAFFDKGISLQKYWLWQQDQIDTQTEGRKMRLYYQDSLRYSLLVQYLSMDQQFVAVAKIIPATGPTLSLVNQVTFLIFTGAGILILIFVYALVRRIIAPLQTIGQTAQSIAHLDFQTVEVHTGDELETLAQDISHMSRCLKQAHAELEEKNQQMEALLSNVSHDLKTPVSLIRMYASGIKDGLDDGTFLDTIISQNQRMELLIQQLLCLSRQKQLQPALQPVNLSQCVLDLLAQYRLSVQEGDISFHTQIEPDLIIDSDGETVELILSNLISNAVKYSDDRQIHILLRREDNSCVFQIKNLVSNPRHLDPDSLWLPFYVGEESRNTQMSGTGLGLSIVKAAAKELGVSCQVSITDHKICFTIIF